MENNMATTRIRHAKDQKELEAVRDDYITQGYSVKNEGLNTTILNKSSWGTLSGHILVALFTIWWTLGIGNLVYALIVHKSDEVMIKIDEPV
jgi:hypothetical protein